MVLQKKTYIFALKIRKTLFLLINKKKVMKVREVNLGGGLVRLIIEPTCSCERSIPTSVVDDIARDVFSRKHTCCVEPKHNVCSCTPNREPDGIDIHVDRPLRENFRSHMSWCDAMAKYRTLERVAKDCDWECREPMKGTPNYRNFSEPKWVPNEGWEYFDMFDDDDDDFWM